jgi:hypothetical protein
MKQPTPSDFIVNVEESNVSVIFKPTDRDYSFDRLTDPEDIARHGRRRGAHHAAASAMPSEQPVGTDVSYIGVKTDKIG